MLSSDPITWTLCCFALIAAIYHILGGKALEKYAIGHGIISADRSVKMSALVLLGIAVCLALDDLSLYGGYALGAFLIFTAFGVHKFWNVADPTLRTSESLNFVKNIFFGAIVVLYYLLECSPSSVDF